MAKPRCPNLLGNCIYLSDDEKTVRTKVMSMFTDPTHLKVEDPGHTENNPVFIYLDAFAKMSTSRNSFRNIESCRLKGRLRERRIGRCDREAFLSRCP
jgi:tryptophanyl-tRNA synthetase